MADEELGKSISHNYWVQSSAKSDELFEASETISNRNFVKKYQLIWYFFYIAKLVGHCLDVSRVQIFIIFILKKLSKGVEEVENLKKSHVQTMKLISYLARDPSYWDFINKGMFKMQTEMDPKEMMGDIEDFEKWDLISSESPNEKELISPESPNGRNTTSLGPPEEKELISSESLNERNITSLGPAEEKDLISSESLNERNTTNLDPTKEKELISSESLNERNTTSLGPREEKDALISSESPNQRNTSILGPPKEKDLTSSENDLILVQRNFILEITNLITVQNNLIKEFKEQIKSSAPEAKKGERSRWDESPLIVGVKMGLYDFVEQILKVYPQSAQFRDLKGRNVLQVAIEHGQVKIVEIIAKMTKGPNPVLPSWLLSDLHKENTILHYAAEPTTKEDWFALQMQQEIKWFERVRKLVQKDLVNNRDENQRTALELFNDNHSEMMKTGRTQLEHIGTTCAGLLAAVVFVSSYSIPGSKNPGTDHQGNNSNNESVGFKVLSHAYVTGLSFATCSLLLFLSLLTSNYSPEAFRKSLPTKFMLAVASFVIALLGLAVAFAGDVYFTIYGGATLNAIPLILELTGFPFLCAVVLFFGGFGLRFSSFIKRIIHP